jgi:hypothetical protein
MRMDWSRPPTRTGAAVQVGRDLGGGLQVAVGQEEVLTAGREVRRESAADVAGADDGNRGVSNGHRGSPFVTWFPGEAGGAFAGSKAAENR